MSPGPNPSGLSIQAEKQYFPALTGVRAVMMYGVFNCHFNLLGREAYGEPLYRYSPWLYDVLFRFTHELAVGVPVFYVLSGFLIYYRYGHGLARLDAGWTARYVQNRAARIYPVYFLTLLLTYLVVGLPDLRTTLVTFTMTQSFFPDLVKAGIPQAWTLTIEETFYFTAPLIFLAARRFGILAPCLAIALLGAFLVNVNFPLNPYYGNPAHVFGRTICGPIGCFGFGVYLAQVLIRRGGNVPQGRRPLWTYVGVALATLVVLAVSRIGHWIPPNPADPDHVARGVEHGLGAVLIFAVFPAFVILAFWGLITERSLLARILASRLLVLLGGASYCFYLIHVGVIQQFIFDYISTNYLVLFVLINLLSIAMFKLIEKPANGYVKNLGRPPAKRHPIEWPAVVESHGATVAYAFVAAAVCASLALPAWLDQTGNFETMSWLLAEDGPYESLQVVLCLAGAVILLYCLWRFSARGQLAGLGRWRGIFVAALALMLLLMVGEELSWGQRILGYGSPEWLLERNYQGELTLHNLDVFQPAGSENRLQTVWTLAMFAYLGVLPVLARPWPRLRDALEGRGLPLASFWLGLLCIGSSIWYVVTMPSSEVIELVFDVLLVALACEIYARLRAAEPALGDQAMPVAVTAAVVPMVFLLMFQAGEAALPSMRSQEIAEQANRHVERGSVQAAVELYQEALGAWPRNAMAHYNLAQTLLHLGRFDEAADHLEQVAALEPDHVESRAQLGQLAAMSGRLSDAVRWYRQTLNLAPHDHATANNLAWLLATCPDAQVRDGREAVRLARAACDATAFQAPNYLSTLAAAYAEAGDFEAAIETSSRAIELATAAGEVQLVSRNQERIEQYQTGRPYREPPLDSRGTN